jgi:ribosome-binding factor A
MANERRGYRVAERIQILIAQELQRVSDPRLTLITISRCEISPDLKHAKIFWMLFGDEEKRSLAAEALDESTSMFRKYLASQLKLRTVPSIKFIYDSSLDEAQKMEELFQRIRNEEGRDS